MTRRTTPEQRKMAEHIVQETFLAEVQLKAAMLVIHRVRRTMDLRLDTIRDVEKQRKAFDQLATFADTHPLPADLERLL